MKTEAIMANTSVENPIKKKGTLIMTVEDDPVSRRIIQTVLEKSGYLVETAASAEDALLALRKMVPAVLILDVMMPAMSGFDLCHIIKRDARLQKIPVVFLTTRDTPADFKSGAEVGAVFYLTKPVRPDRLLQTVRMLAAPV